MPAAKRKSADRVAATRAIFLGLLGVVGVALIGLGIYFSSGGGHVRRRLPVLPMYRYG